MREADVTAATGGASMNFVLKSGSNRPSGSGRYIFTSEDLQSANLPDDLAGEAIALPMRVFHLADTVEVHHRARGADAANARATAALG